MRDGETQFLYTELGNWGMEDPDFTLYISRGGWKIASDHRGFADRQTAGRPVGRH